jgi:peptidoglycan/xylan/chitin deacetylase (PgdA/CDA1 family)
MDVIILCHTECGFVNKGVVIYDKNAVSGVKVGVPNLIKLADKYGAKITFAVCPEVADCFPGNTDHEIALHIHPGMQKYRYKEFNWTTGDLYLRKHTHQSIDSTVLQDYPYREQAEMIKTGKDYLTGKFNRDIRAFVAGRWSLNNDTVKVLVENGITHDCSAPAHSISDHYEWSRLPRICMPYRPSAADYQSKGDLPILMVPISQTFLGGTVTPEGIPTFGYSWLKACFSEYYKQAVPLFHLCLHSPSMTDDYFISAMDKLLSFISGHEGINFKFAPQIGEYPDRNYKTNIYPYILSVNREVIKSGIRKILRIKNEKYSSQSRIVRV